MAIGKEKKRSSITGICVCSWVRGREIVLISKVGKQMAGMKCRELCSLRKLKKTAEEKKIQGEWNEVLRKIKDGQKKIVSFQKKKES